MSSLAKQILGLNLIICTKGPEHSLNVTLNPKQQIYTFIQSNNLNLYKLSEM